MRIKFICWLMPVLTIIACNAPLDKAEREYLATADSTSLSSDIAPINSPSRKRIRTADIKCRVENVYKAATLLEKVTTSLNGIVEESRMQNENGTFKEFNYKADSIKRVQIYTPTAYLTLRIPVNHFDSVVTLLSSSAQFINFRTLKQEDATFRYLSNALKNDEPSVANAATENVKRPAPVNNSLKAIQYADTKKEQVIERRIENLQLLDHVEYATLTVHLFQPEMEDVYTIADAAYITRAGFGSSIAMSLISGTGLLRDILLFILQLWPLWIIGILVWFFIYRNVFRFSAKKQRV